MCGVRSRRLFACRKRVVSKPGSISYSIEQNHSTCSIDRTGPATLRLVRACPPPAWSEPPGARTTTARADGRVVETLGTRRTRRGRGPHGGAPLRRAARRPPPANSRVARCPGTRARRTRRDRRFRPREAMGKKSRKPTFQILQPAGEEAELWGARIESLILESRDANKKANDLETPVPQNSRHVILPMQTYTHHWFPTFLHNYQDVKTSGRHFSLLFERLMIVFRSVLVVLFSCASRIGGFRKQCCLS